MRKCRRGKNLFSYVLLSSLDCKFSNKALFQNRFRSFIVSRCSAVSAYLAKTQVWNLMFMFNAMQASTQCQFSFP